MSRSPLSNGTISFTPRYTQYFAEIVRGVHYLRSRPLRLQSVTVTGLPETNPVYVQIFNYSEKSLEPTLLFASEDELPVGGTLAIPVILGIDGDVLLRFWWKKGKKEKKLFHLIVNTSFISQMETRFGKSELDGIKKKDKKFQGDVSVLIHWAESPSPDTPKANYEPFASTCIERYTNLHTLRFFCQHENGLPAFRAFLLQTSAPSLTLYLRFWLDIEKFRKLRQPAVIYEWQQHLKSVYLDKNGPHTLPLPPLIIEQTKTLIENLPEATSVFDLAYEHVNEILEKQYLVDFLKTPYAAAFLSGLRFDDNSSPEPNLNLPEQFLSLGRTVTSGVLTIKQRLIGFQRQLSTLNSVEHALKLGKMLIGVKEKLFEAHNSLPQYFPSMSETPPQTTTSKLHAFVTQANVVFGYIRRNLTSVIHALQMEEVTLQDLIAVSKIITGLLKFIIEQESVFKIEHGMQDLVVQKPQAAASGWQGASLPKPGPSPVVSVVSSSSL